MINTNLTLDEAFRLHKKQLDHLDAALAKIKEFPFSQYLHVGFDSGLTKATTFVYNLEYKLPFTLNDTQFIGTAVGSKKKICLMLRFPKNGLRNIWLLRIRKLLWDLSLRIVPIRISGALSVRRRLLRCIVRDNTILITM